MTTPTSPEQPDRAMERLVQQDRIVSKEALVLPIDRKLTAEQHAAIRRAVRDFITDDGGEQAVSYKQIAHEIGSSGPVVSEYMKGKYRGNNDRVGRALNLWLDRHAKRSRARGERRMIQTWVCDEMAAVIRLADRRQKMAAIVSPSGSGKDMLIAALAEELDAVLIYTDMQMTAARLIQAIAQEIGLPVIGESFKLKQRVIKRLKNRSTIILVNEAQQLARRGAGARCASILRSIYDQTGVPIVLIGSAEIFAFIDDRDPASGGGQLYRRCIKVNMLHRASQADDPDRPGQVGRPLFSKDEVRRYLAMKKVRLTGEVFRLMWRIANLVEHGSLGLCGDVLETIADLWPGAEIDTEHVHSALALLLDAEADVVQAKIEAAESDEPQRQAARAG